MDVLGKLRELVFIVFKKTGHDVTVQPNASTAGDVTFDLPMNTAGDQELVGNLATQTLENKSLKDDTTLIIDNADATKTLGFDLGSSTTSTKTTITAAQTGNQTVTLPDATDTLVGKATTDTLTNKTIASFLQGPGNTITVPAATDTLVGKDTTDTLTNKTISSFLQGPGNTITVPAATDTLVGKDTTDILTNKSVDLTDNTVTGTLAEFNTALTDEDFASLGGSETLTNKTINADNNTISELETDNLKAGVLITDTGLAGASDTTVPSTQAVKTYIDTSITAEDLDVETDTGGPISVDLDSQSLTIAGGNALGTSSTGQTVTVSVNDNAILPGTASLSLPSGTTAERPGSPTNNMIRHNTTTSGLERWDGAEWTDLGGGGLTTSFKSANFVAEAAKNYVLTSNITSITFPSGVDGDVIRITRDRAGGVTWESSNVTITPNGAETMDGDATFVLDSDVTDFLDFIYEASSTNWISVTPITNSSSGSSNQDAGVSYFTNGLFEDSVSSGVTPNSGADVTAETSAPLQGTQSCKVTQNATGAAAVVDFEIVVTDSWPEIAQVVPLVEALVKTDVADADGDWTFAIVNTTDSTNLYGPVDLAGSGEMNLIRASATGALVDGKTYVGRLTHTVTTSSRVAIVDRLRLNPINGNAIVAVSDYVEDQENQNAVSMSGNTWTTICQIDVPDGTWDISWSILATAGAGSSIKYAQGGVATAASSSPGTIDIKKYNIRENGTSSSTIADENSSVPVPGTVYRETFTASSTTLYLNLYMSNTGGAGGFICARRVT